MGVSTDSNGHPTIGALPRPTNRPTALLKKGAAMRALRRVFVRPAGEQRGTIARAGTSPIVEFRAYLPLLVTGTLVTVASLGVLGGGPTEPVRRSNAAAELSVEIPQKLRSGMLFETRIQVRSARPLHDLTIGLSPQIWRRITINSQIPEPESQDFHDGQFRLHFGPLESGKPLEIRLESQVNPARWGRASGTIKLYDKDQAIMALPISMTVLP